MRGQGGEEAPAQGERTWSKGKGKGREEEDLSRRTFIVLIWRTTPARGRAGYLRMCIDGLGPRPELALAASPRWYPRSSLPWTAATLSHHMCPPSAEEQLVGYESDREMGSS